MNILFLLRLWPVYGGGETVTITLANEFARRGINVSVAYFKDSTRADLPYIDKRVSVFRITGTSCDEFSMPDVYVEKTVSQLSGILCQEKINIIINQWWTLDYIKKIKERFPYIKIVHCHHTAFYNPVFEGHSRVKVVLKKLVKPLYLSYIKKKSVVSTLRFLPYVEKFLFLSKTFVDQFYEFYENDNISKISYIPNPINVKQNENFHGKKNIVLFVGRMLESPKRVSIQIKLWKCIEDSMEFQDWKFVLIGDGPDLNYYKDLSHSLQLKNIEFLGFADPCQYYQVSKILLLTSSFEGFGMTLIEAQSHGVVPVVMDSFPALRDIIENGYNGIITPNNNFDAMLSNLKNLMSDESKLNQYSRNGLDSSSSFNVCNVVDKWMNLLNSI